MEPINWTDEVQAYAAIAGVIVSAMGYLFIYFQIRQTTQSIQHSSSTSIYQISSDFYRFLAENPHLRKYFYKNAPLPTDELEAHQIWAACEYLADFFEFVLIESKLLDPRIFESWNEYINAVFDNSQVFRQFIDENKNNYTAELLNSLGSSKKKLGSKE